MWPQVDEKRFCCAVTSTARGFSPFPMKKQPLHAPLFPVILQKSLAVWQTPQWLTWIKEKFSEVVLCCFIALHNRDSAEYHFTKKSSLWFYSSRPWKGIKRTVVFYGCSLLLRNLVNVYCEWSMIAWHEYSSCTQSVGYFIAFYHRLLPFSTYWITDLYYYRVVDCTDLN